MHSAWHHCEAEEVLAQLKSVRTGLTDHEATQRRHHVGRNELPRERTTLGIVVFARQLKSSLVAILLIAAAVSFALQDFVDAYVILAAVVVNVLVGFAQESKAEHALAALRSFVRFTTIVRRDHAERLVDAAELVPGDIIVLKAGARVPADARLLHAHHLSVNESALTGESQAVEKSVHAIAEASPLAERTNMMYLGTTVEAGEGLGVVVATGHETEVGSIAGMLREAEDRPTPLQERLRSFSTTLGVFTLAAATAIFLLGLALGKRPVETFTLAVALAVAAIPEGLLVGVTAILAVGMKRILDKKALVRKLIAAETLGSTTVICTDKTGTLTEGAMSVVRIVTGEQELGISATDRLPPEHLREGSSVLLSLIIGIVCNDAHITNEDAAFQHRQITGSPTERALAAAAHVHGLTRASLDVAYPRIDSIPFSSEAKLMATLHTVPRGRMIMVKGAPEQVLARSLFVDLDGKARPLTNERRTAMLATADHMSGEGLRVLAVAFRHVPATVDRFTDEEALGGLTIVGLFGMKDPLRATAKQTVALCRSAGIRVVMVTGDHPLTATAIARELDLPVGRGHVMTGQELAQLSDADLTERVETISVFARVSPSDKLRIVNAWQARGDVVAVSGDGVNDAPALQSAAIGVALGSGTEVAKQAADMVLLDDTFATIVAAVGQGRVIFDNVRKVVLYLISDSLAAVLVILLAFFVDAVVLDLPVPLLAAQILWINLIADGLPNLALTVEPEESDVMAVPPRDPKEPIVTRQMYLLALAISGIMGVATFLAYLMSLGAGSTVEHARTVAFVCLGMVSLLSAFSVRSLRHTIWQTSPWANRYLLLAMLGGVAIQLVAVYFPPLQRILGTSALGAGSWFLLAGVAVASLALIESMKRFFLRHHDSSLHVR